MVRSLSKLALLLAMLSGPATAGVYSDDLGKCLVSHTGEQDHIVLVKWMFAALSVHPAVQPLVAITAEQRTASNQGMVLLVSRLLGDECRKEALAALKYEGTIAVQVSFNLLGQVASRDLGVQADVKKAFGEFGDDLKKDEKFQSLVKEAGVAPK
jgi:hypothetical protein